MWLLREGRRRRARTPPPGVRSLLCSCNSDREMASPQTRSKPVLTPPTLGAFSPRARLHRTHSRLVQAVDAEPSARCCRAGLRLRGAPPPTGAPARLGGPPGTSCRLGGRTPRSGGRRPCPGPRPARPGSLCAHRPLCARLPPMFTRRV